MTTQTYSSVLDHTGNEGFRAWGQELGINLALAGLVQTADTGQINWATVNRPGTNTSAGYEVWRFADSSLYLLLEFGTSGSAAQPQMWVTVGQGSNGSGALTGQQSTRAVWFSLTTAASIVTAYTTYICVLADALSIVFKANSTASLYPQGYLVVGKSVDGAGAASTLAFAVLRQTSNGPSLQTVRIAATAATFNDTVNLTVIPGAPTSSFVGADIQAYQCWMNAPQVLPFVWACVYVNAEITKLNTFSVAMVAAASHTYLAGGQLSGSGSLNNQSGTTYTLGFIYE